MADGNVSIQGLEFDLKASMDKSATEAIDNLASSLSRLQDVLGSGFNSTGATSSVKNIAKAINTTNKSSTSAVAKSLSGNKEVTYNSTNTEEEANKQKSLKQIEEEQKKAHDDLARAYSSDIYKSAKAFMGGFGSTVKKTTSFMGNMLTTAKDLGGSVWDRLTSGVRSSVAQFESLRRSFGRILLYRVIRTLIKDIGAAFQTGIGDLYQYSTLMGGTFAKSMDTIATSMLYLKNSMATMAAPLINAVAPAIDYLIDKVVELMNVIAQALATLTGAGTWNKAIKYPVKYAAAAGDASGAVKALEKTVLGFDELNRLNDNNKSSGGSGFNAGDYESMFTTENVSNKIADMMKGSNWTDVGAAIANGLNSGMTKVDAWIKGKFTTTAQLWATRMGTLLNGFVSKFNWNQLGVTFGDGLNAIISAMNTFYSSASDAFWKIGTGLGTSINSFFAIVDWSGVGTYLSNKLNSWIQIFASFFTELAHGAYANGFDLGVMLKNFFINIDWDGIRTGLKQMLSTVAQTLEGFITGTDGSFDGFTDEFANTINSFFANPDLDRILKSIGDIINSIVDGLGKLNWRQIGEAVGKALGSIDWNNVLQTFVDALEGMMGGFFEGMFNSEHGSTTLLLMTAIGGLGGAFSAGNILKDELLKQLATDIGAKLVGSEGLGSLTVEGGTTMTAVKGIGGTLGNTLMIGAIAALAAYDITAFLQILKINGQIANEVQNKTTAQMKEAAIEQAYLASKGVKVNIDDIVAAIKQGVDTNDIMAGNFSATVTETTDDITDTTNGTVQGVKETVHTYVNGILQDTKDGMTAAGTTVEDGFGGISGTVNSSLNDINTMNGDCWVSTSDTAKAKLDEMNTNTSTTYSSISSTVQDKLNQMAIDSGTSFDNLATGYSDKLSGMDDDTTTKFASISSTMSDKLEQMKTDSNTKFEELANGYSGKLDDMNTDSTTKMDTLKTNFGNDIDSLKGNLGFSWSLPDISAPHMPTPHIMSGSLNPIDWITGDNGGFPDIEWYANGGFPEDGLFMANHGEMVGQFSNGRTAVANNEQIVAGIQQGVYTAMMAAMSDGNSNSDSTPQVNVFIGNEQLDSYVASSNKRMALASGGR